MVLAYAFLVAFFAPDFDFEAVITGLFSCFASSARNCSAVRKSPQRRHFTPSERPTNSCLQLIFFFLLLLWFSDRHIAAAWELSPKVRLLYFGAVSTQRRAVVFLAAVVEVAAALAIVHFGLLSGHEKTASRSGRSIRMIFAL